MKAFYSLIMTLSLFTINAQEIIELPFSDSSDIQWIGGEKDYYSEAWDTRVITNVSKPTLTIYKPEAGNDSGVSVIIAPGGGMYAHSIESEGIQVAQWLNSKGITAFVLKYRLVPYNSEATSAFSDPNENVLINAKKILPLATQDGLSSIAFVRKNAKQLGLDPNKIGFMGFSAGGAVAMNVTYTAQTENQPNFIVPVYAWMIIVDKQDVPNYKPKMLLICASDDPLELAPMTIELYNDWTSAKITTGLHMYSRGGHGFGMRTKNTASDKWIERFYEWAIDENIISK